MELSSLPGTGARVDEQIAHQLSCLECRAPTTHTSIMSSKYLQEIPARPLADVPPPAYVHSTAPPPYVEQEEDSNDEPFTVARVLFQYGFVCPLLWFVGAFILMLPLQPPASGEETMTVEERDALSKMLHEAEVKWSRRCFAASLAFFIVFATIVTTVILLTGH